MNEDTINAMVEWIEAVKAACKESIELSSRVKQRVLTTGDELIGCLENDEMPKRKL